MNNRFKQLAEQCNMSKLVDTWEYEEFGELIVRECAGLFNNVYATVESEHGPLTVDASLYIKKHFGVEL